MEQNNTEVQPHNPPPLRPMLPPAYTIFKSSISFYKAHIGIILGVALVPSILSMALILIDEQLMPMLFIVMVVLSVLVSMLSYIALAYVISKDGNVEGDILGSYSVAVKLFTANIWMSFLSTAVIAGGTLLLIVPGVYIALAVSLGLYILVTENKRGFNALIQSWYYIKGYWGHVLGKFAFLGLMMIIAFIVIGFVAGLIALATGSIDVATLSSDASTDNPIISLISQLVQGLVIVPITTIYGYMIYRWLRLLKTESIPAEVEADMRKKLQMLSILGIFFIVLLCIILGYTITRIIQNFPEFPSSSSSLPSAVGLSDLLKLWPW